MDIYYYLVDWEKVKVKLNYQELTDINLLVTDEYECYEFEKLPDNDWINYYKSDYYPINQLQARNCACFISWGIYNFLESPQKEYFDFITVNTFDYVQSEERENFPDITPIHKLTPHYTISPIKIQKTLMLWEDSNILSKIDNTIKMVVSSKYLNEYPDKKYIYSYEDYKEYFLAWIEMFYTAKYSGKGILVYI